MIESRHQVLVIGGGTAARLSRSGRKLGVAVIEAPDKHFYQPLWTLVGAGILPRETPPSKRRW